MSNLPKTYAGLKAIANRSFCPTDRTQAVCQYLVTAIDHRNYYHASGTMSTHRFYIDIAIRSIAKAKRIASASDWRFEMSGGIL